MSRKNQLLLFGAAILIFFIASQFVLKDQEPTLTIEDEEEQEPAVSAEDLPPRWKTAESKEEVTEFFKREISGLEQAREQDLTVQHNQNIDFTHDPEKEMEILESWYNEYEIFFLYKIDADDITFEQNEPPRLLETTYIEKLDGDVKDQELRTMRQSGPAILFDGEIHSYTKLTAIRGDHEIETTGEGTRTGMIPVKEFNETVLASFHVHLGDSSWKTNEANLHLSYDPSTYDVTTYTFDEDFSEQSGVSYKPLRIENDLRGLRLYMKVKSETPLSQRIDARLHAEEQYGSIAAFNHLLATDKDNVYVSRTETLAEQPDIPKLTLNRFHVKSDVTFSFDADTRDFQEKVSIDSNKKTMDIDKTLGTYNNTTVTLEEKTYTYPTQMEWNLTLEPDENAGSYLTPAPFRPVIDEFGVGSVPVRHVKIENASEDSPPAGFIGGGYGEEMSIYSERYDIGDQMPVTFTVYNLTDAIPFQTQSTAER
ncbi:hypothetical protein [Salimicrobium halophilum]|uniref:Uncharacterized protein n=1 Tax=Salimicrobium halophilum TaxID=86666 RepID=A0A1G8VSA4_9BACI|nr:hypothetical protein [Salimicrobium halophilum]SDJ68978.1 hypothetical protein SAMN04490247_2873 [Salimicrobium halophilum]